MARQNHGPLSRAKGKIGGVVYQQYEGMQISREYQPVVKNPQTTKQIENRAKFKLASQITAEFKRVLSARLANLSIYERMRRAASVNAIYGVVSTSTPATPSALVAAVVNAINEKNVTGYAAIPVEFDSGDNQFEITGGNGMGITYQICGYDEDGKLTVSMAEDFVSSGEVKNVAPVTGKINVIMAVGYQALTDAGRATISNAGNDGTKWYNAIARGVASGDLAISNIGYAVEIFS